MSLYNTYRPTSLSEIKGNETIKESLEGMMKKPEKINHSFLLTGQTGCGKTTIARVIGNLLEIDPVDFREIDSADFRGIDTIREIRKNAQFKPIKSKYRAFLLDECHQLSKDAQSALLKILEDTPKHVFFLLATTDPQKLLPTIKNRCNLMEVKPLSEKQTYRLIKSIVNKENDSLEKEIIEQIIESSQGLPRKALTILEQVLNVEPSKRLEAAKKLEESENEIIELARALMKENNWNRIKGILKGLKNQEPESIRRVVMGYASAILLNKDDTKAAIMLEEFIEPTYNSGFNQIVYACYNVIKS